jgi:hypothetical protein
LSSPSIALRRRLGLLPVAFLVGLAITVALVVAGDWLKKSPRGDPAPPLHLMSTPFIMPGLRQPPTHPAKDAPVADDAEVIGVSSGGRHRAYLVSAMSRMNSHVVNDLLGGAPVTVTYCDRTRCARAFTAEAHPDPLDFSVGGFLDEQMLLRVDGTFFYQGTGRRTAGREDEVLPFAAHPFERTSWKVWKEAHPDTDIYIGLPVAREPGPGEEDVVPP